MPTNRQCCLTWSQGCSCKCAHVISGFKQLLSKVKYEEPPLQQPIYTYIYSTCSMLLCQLTFWCMHNNIWHNFFLIYTMSTHYRLRNQMLHHFLVLQQAWLCLNVKYTLCNDQVSLVSKNFLSLAPVFPNLSVYVHYANNISSLPKHFQLGLNRGFPQGFSTNLSLFVYKTVVYKYLYA